MYDYEYKLPIIYLNGPSSYGKTTLAHLLQQEQDPPFLHIGIDRVIGMMPDKLNDWEGGPAPLGFSWKNSTDETGHPVHEIQLRAFAKKMSDTLKEIVQTLARLNHYIIIDDVALESWCRQIIFQFIPVIIVSRVLIFIFQFNLNKIINKIIS